MTLNYKTLVSGRLRYDDKIEDREVSNRIETRYKIFNSKIVGDVTS